MLLRIDISRSLSQGLLKSALDIFLRWEAWPEVINCYMRLGESGAAERVIRARLEQDPSSVQLLCALGDVTGDRASYERAWEASGQRSARAARSLGFLLCREGRYEEALPHLERSLEINPLHHGTAFAFGCAAMQHEDFERAETAFRRCTSIEPDVSSCLCFSAAADCGMRRVILCLLSPVITYSTKVSKARVAASFNGQ